MQLEAARALAEAAAVIHEEARAHKRAEAHHRRQAQRLNERLNQLRRDAAASGIQIELTEAARRSQ